MNFYFKVFLLALIFYHPCRSQELINFSSFEGEVLNIPLKKGSKGYINDVENYQVIGHVSYEEINFPERNNDILMPGIKKTQLFGMILNLSMQIMKKGCYEFTLNSDDGSILWINETEIINNDGYHAMRLRKETILLDAKDYRVKLWYYQAYPTRYGFIFDGKYLEDSIECQPIIPEKKSLALNSEMYFEYNSAKLSKNADINLDSVIQQIKAYQPKIIKVIGHTDNLGSEKFNLKLSYDRANHIKEKLQSLLADPSILFEVEGKDETEPVTQNFSEKERARNRRVEIIIEK